MTAVASAGGRPGIRRVNPVTRLGAALVVTAGPLLSIDPVTAAAALVGSTTLLPWSAARPGTLARRMLPIAVAAAIAAGATVLYGRPDGALHLEWGLVRITDGSLYLGASILLRVLAIAAASVVLFTALDPTDLADGLAQRLHLPARFVLGSLAGARLVSLMMEDWRELESARRTRGVAARGRLRRFAGQALALLVLALRRGTALATAMEARGFGADVPRTWARRSRFGPGDIVLMVTATSICGAVVIAAVAAGTWTPVLGL